MPNRDDAAFEKRSRRILDTVALKATDRVPFTPMITFYHANRGGISCRDAMFDLDKLYAAAKETILEVKPDSFNNPFALMALGPMLDLLDCRLITWPGQRLPVDLAYQFVEKEYVTAAEYDDFLFDPTGFVLTKYLPRIYGTLEPLTRIPQLPSIYYTRFLTGTRAFGTPEVAGALESLVHAGQAADRMLMKAQAFSEEMAALGFPEQIGGVAYAPFDYIGDFFRGTRGIMLDMFRVPEKLHRVMEKTIPFILAGAINAAKATGVPFIFMPLHKGLDGFMSPEQFNEFYWPYLKAVIVKLIEEDLIPMVLWEGDCTSRLETIRDIPEARAIYAFERTDIFRAKEVLRDRVCIRGNVSSHLLCIGTPEEVREYCRKLIDVVGEGGGFLLDGAIGIPDEAKPENVQAMADSIRETGEY